MIFFSFFKFLHRVRVKLHTALIRGHFRTLDSYIDPRVDITNPQYISIGKGVSIRPYTWIYAIINDSGQKNRFMPSILIGDNTSIARFCHITCSNQLTIEDHVFITEGVLITDSIHGYEDIQTPISQQPLISRGPIIIGAGTWIGNGACVIGKVTIGRNCVIAANAVVNQDVPNYCVVAGVPARIVRQYDINLQTWIKPDKSAEG